MSCSICGVEYSLARRQKHFEPLFSFELEPLLIRMGVAEKSKKNKKIPQYFLIPEIRVWN